MSNSKNYLKLVIKMNIVMPLDLLNFVIVRIPANSVAVVNGTGPNFPRLYDVIVEPSQTTGY